VIRLSYYGGGHYDSIHKFGAFDAPRARSDNQEKVSRSSVGRALGYLSYMYWVGELVNKSVILVVPFFVCL
jgi:hypothetical protein